MVSRSSLRVVVAEDERDTREYLLEALVRLGHQAVAVGDGWQLVELCRASPPDVVLSDVRMPHLDGLGAAAEVSRHRPVPFVLITAYHEDALLERACEGPVMAYLVKPAKVADVGAALALAVDRFERLRAAGREVAGLRQALEDRKLIDRAKGALMRQLGVGEEEAYRRLSRLSNSRNRKMTEVAGEVLAAEEVFRQAEES
jgi:response regulator NasT